MKRQSGGYSTTARVFHWLVALMVLLMIPAGVTMVQEGLSRPLQNMLYVFHKNTGLIVLIVVAMRLAYRWRNPPPPIPSELPGWQRVAAKISHGALYALLFLMPLAGYVRVRAGGFPIEGLDLLGIGTLVPRSDALADVAKTIHYFGGLAIGAFLLLHVSAAAYHGMIRRDGVFSRMWPPFATRNGSGGVAGAGRHD